MEPVVAMVLRMESVYLIESATSTPAAREEVAALAYEVAASCSGCAAAQCRLVHLDGPLDGPIELWLGLTPPSTSLRVVGGGCVPPSAPTAEHATATLLHPTKGLVGLS